MFSTLRNRFGIPGVISVIALVFAMFGGAYAASNNSGGDNATASAKAKKGPRGPRGKTGPAGPAGAQGPAGANGKDGSNGQNGADGEDGTDGKSVQTGNATVGNCPDGGATVQVVGEPATLKNICNGADGADGTDGSPWTAGGTLPPGATETGVWAFGETVSGQEMIRDAIAFPIPLAQGLTAAHVHFIDTTGKEVIFNADTLAVEQVTPTECLGSVSAPTALPGNLCVYSAQLVKATMFAGENDFGASGINTASASSAPGASTTGAVLKFTDVIAEARGAGTFAVTGCGTGFPCP